MAIAAPVHPDSKFTAEEMRAIQTLAQRLGFPAEPGRTADCHVINLTSASLRLPIYTMAKDRRGRYHLLTPDGRDLVTTDRFDRLIAFFGEDPRILDARDRAPECWGERSVRARP